MITFSEFDIIILFCLSGLVTLIIAEVVHEFDGPDKH